MVSIEYMQPTRCQAHNIQEFPLKMNSIAC